MSNIESLAKQLVRFRSLSCRELELAEFIRDYFGDRGIPAIFDRFSPSDYGAGTVGAVDTANVYLDIGEGADALFLYGHTDVVDAADPVLFEPRVKAGYLHGRGAVDMKSSVAGLMTTAVAEHDRIRRSGHRILFAFIADEETSGSGARRSVDWLRGLGLRKLECVLFEPTNDFREVEVGAKGYIFFELSGPLRDMFPFLKTLLEKRDDLAQRYLPSDDRFGKPLLTLTTARCEPSLEFGSVERRAGLSAHAARPELGKNALEEIVMAVDTPIINLYTVGGSHNTIADSAAVHASASYSDVHSVVHLDVRTTPEADESDGLLADFTDLLERHGSGLNYRIQKRGRAFCTPPDDELVALCKRSAPAETHEEVAFGGSDAGYYSELTPHVIGGFGPGLRALQHSQEERISLDSLRSVPAVLRRLINFYLEGDA